MNPVPEANPDLQAPLCDPAAAASPDLAPSSEIDAESWRTEVAARLARYRTRRKPRSPRYPSLLLPFETPDSWSKAASDMPLEREASRASDDELMRREAADSDAEFVYRSEPPQLPAQTLEAEQSAKVIEFPRSAAIPVFHASTLADPIFDRPRIIEAPEVVPPPPALGGMLMDAVQQEPADRRSVADALMRPASIPWRCLATFVDWLILTVALSAFGAIFLRLNPIRGPIPLLGGIGVAVALTLWMTYQFLFVVYTGSTPGLRAARLRIARFDGSAAPRCVRRWRVLAGFLSGLSAGLGYLWCFLDQDSLCWHDRITRTHLQRSESSH